VATEAKIPVLIRRLHTRCRKICPYLSIRGNFRRTSTHAPRFCVRRAAATAASPQIREAALKNRIGKWIQEVLRPAGIA
jgi:hypothetical protein